MKASAYTAHLEAGFRPSIDQALVQTSAPIPSARAASTFEEETEMSIERAKDFLKFLQENPDVAEKMQGFTQEELQEAAKLLKNEGQQIPVMPIVE